MKDKLEKEINEFYKSINNDSYMESSKLALKLIPKLTKEIYELENIIKDLNNKDKYISESYFKRKVIYEGTGIIKKINNKFIK